MGDARWAARSPGRSTHRSRGRTATGGERRCDAGTVLHGVKFIAKRVRGCPHRVELAAATASPTYWLPSPAARAGFPTLRNRDRAAANRSSVDAAVFNPCCVAGPGFCARPPVARNRAPTRKRPHRTQDRHVAAEMSPYRSASLCSVICHVPSSANEPVTVSTAPRKSLSSVSDIAQIACRGRMLENGFNAGSCPISLNSVGTVNVVRKSP